MRKYENKKRAALVKEFIRCGALSRSIETGATAASFPDVYLCERIVALIEVKKDDKPGPAWTRKLSFEDGQYSFLKRNYEHGGQSFTAVFYENGVMFSHITGIDQATERPLQRASHLFLEKIEGNGATVLAWMRTFEEARAPL